MRFANSLGSVVEVRKQAGFPGPPTTLQVSIPRRASPDEAWVKPRQS